MVLDVVVRHWIQLVEDGEAGTELWGREIQRRVVFFHKDDGLIVLMDPECLQGEFEAFMCLFDLVGLRTSMGKIRNDMSAIPLHWETLRCIL